MTKSELRRARKQARAEGRKFGGITEREQDREIFTETARGYRARWAWAERYDRLNGAPESDEDR